MLFHTPAGKHDTHKTKMREHKKEDAIGNW